LRIHNNPATAAAVGYTIPRHTAAATANCHYNPASGNADTHGHATDSATSTYALTGADCDCDSEADFNSAQDQAWPDGADLNAERESKPDTDHARW
jgi:hypothetical protein